MFGLSFLAPAFLVGAAFAAVPIVLHLLGRRPSARVLFPAVRLLKRAPAQETRRRRLRELVLLALRVGAIFLLAIAFARPYFPVSAATSPRSAVIVALDRSFSMSAPGQFSRAVSLARRAIIGAPPGAPVGLVAFDDEARVLVKPTADRTAVLRALADVRPGYGSTAYATALARAAEALGAANGRVVLVTDLQRNGWERRDTPISSGIDVVVEDSGAPASNLAVSDARRAENGGLTAIVRNNGPTRRTGRAHLTIDGQARGVMPFAVEASAVQEIAFPGPLPATGVAAVEIDDWVGYQADNKAYALLDPPEAPSLLAMTGEGDPSRGSFYVQRALEVDGARFFHLDTQSAGRFSTGGLNRYAALFLLGTRGLSNDAAKALGDYVHAGGGVFAVLDDQVDPPVLDRLLGANVSVWFATVPPSAGAGILPVDTRHPVLQSIDPDLLNSVRFERVARTTLGHDAILARFSDGSPALVEQKNGAGRVLLFNSDLSNRWNDLPLQPAFVPLVHQIARYLARDRMPVREFLVSAVPPGVPHQPGVATLSATATRAGSIRSGRIVVNVDPRESDVSRITAAQFEQLIPRVHGRASARLAVDQRQAALQQGLWRLAIALAIVALLAEGLIGRTINR